MIKKIITLLWVIPLFAFSVSFIDDYVADEWTTEQQEKFIEEALKNQKNYAKDQIIIADLEYLYDWFTEILDWLDTIDPDKYLIAIKLVKDYTTSYNDKISTDQMKQRLEEIVSALELAIKYTEAKNLILQRDFEWCKNTLQWENKSYLDVKFDFHDKYMNYMPNTRNQQLGGWNLKNFCIKQQAILENDRSFCDLIANPNERWSCINSYVQIYWDITNCYDVWFDPDSALSCIRSFAMRWDTVDPNICFDISDLSDRQIYSCLSDLKNNYTQILEECDEDDIKCKKILSIKSSMRSWWWSAHTIQFVEWLTEAMCQRISVEYVPIECKEMVKVWEGACDYLDFEKEKLCKSYNAWIDAIESNDHTKCEATNYVLPDRVWLCIRNIASINNDEEMCYNMDGHPSASHWAHSCVYDIVVKKAIDKWDSDYCENRKLEDMSPNRLEDCKRDVEYWIINDKIKSAQKDELKTSLCDWITNEPRKDQCLMSIMNLNESRNDCDQLSKSIYDEIYGSCLARQELNK